MVDLPLSCDRDKGRGDYPGVIYPINQFLQSSQLDQNRKNTTIIEGWCGRDVGMGGEHHKVLLRDCTNHE